MRALLRWMFGIDNAAPRPTRAERRVEDELRTLLHRVDVVEDRLEHLGGRMDQMRVRITNVQRDVARDVDQDDDQGDEQGEFEELVDDHRRMVGRG